MFVSTIIATIGRTILNRAVNSILSQGLPDGAYEVIVVNDTKKPLIDEKLGNQWMSYPPLSLRAPYFYSDRGACWVTNRSTLILSSRPLP